MSRLRPYADVPMGWHLVIPALTLPPVARALGRNWRLSALATASLVAGAAWHAWAVTMELRRAARLAERAIERLDAMPAAGVGADVAWALRLSAAGEADENVCRRSVTNDYSSTIVATPLRRQGAL